MEGQEVQPHTKGEANNDMTNSCSVPQDMVCIHPAHNHPGLAKVQNASQNNRHPKPRWFALLPSQLCEPSGTTMALGCLKKLEEMTAAQAQERPCRLESECVPGSHLLLCYCRRQNNGQCLTTAPPPSKTPPRNSMAQHTYLHDLPISAKFGSGGSQLDPKTVVAKT